jgi:hypothetical protein
MTDNQDKADRIRNLWTDELIYEEEALESLARSWELDGHCQTLALMDAQVWATLHLAEMQRQTRNVMRNRD